MTQLLQKVFSEIEKLPRSEQDALAKWLLKELSSEKQWDKAFARSGDALEKLAEEALGEYKKGRTKPLDSESS